ncbi:hypothetical protein BGX38DRAFT_623014 [Terfezia claveryi]|nr:hypothetical protein BGX38DRAFT_623014 [Terfezia claveryi]
MFILVVDDAVNLRVLVSSTLDAIYTGTYQLAWLPASLTIAKQWAPKLLESDSVVIHFFLLTFFPLGTYPTYRTLPVRRQARHRPICTFQRRGSAADRGRVRPTRYRTVPYWCTKAQIAIPPFRLVPSQTTSRSLHRQLCSSAFPFAKTQVCRKKIRFVGSGLAPLLLIASLFV